MRSVKLIVFVFLSAIMLAGCNKTSNTSDKTSEKNATQETSKENYGDNAKNNGRVDPKPDAVPTTTEKSDGSSETKIALSTIQCGTCKKTITKALKTDAGIKDINVNVDEKYVVVNFDKSKTSLDKIEGIITAAGYDANGKKADPKAYDKLESCCKIPEKKN